jgi:TIR domain
LAAALAITHTAGWWEQHGSDRALEGRIPELRIARGLGRAAYLRGARSDGIEVWFDRSELRDGDPLDRRIKKHIQECALFVPIISTTTPARLEGYFRREWKLAVDRTHDMADGKPFLVPVVIDNTNDQEAEVPESFRTVQWTRLRQSETPPAFVERLQLGKYLAKQLYQADTADEQRSLRAQSLGPAAVTTTLSVSHQSAFISKDCFRNYWRST